MSVEDRNYEEVPYPDVNAMTALVATQAFWDLHDIVFFLDTNGIVRFVNGAVEQYGFKASEVIGLAFRDFVHSRDIQTVYERSEARKSGDSERKTLQVTLLDKNRKEHVFEATTSLVYFEKDEKLDIPRADGDKRNSVLCSFGILRDVTYQHESQRHLEDEIKALKLLVKETHHRITNNLLVLRTILDMQANKTKSIEARDALRLAANRMDTLTLIHKNLYATPPGGTLDAAVYVKELVINIDQAFQGMTVELDISFNVDAIELPWRTVTILGLIVNELVTNSIKHAFLGKDKGALHVSLKRMDGLIQLSVADDGVGLRECIDLRKLDSTGMTIIRTLTNQLQGEMYIRHDSGFSTSVTFPVPLSNDPR